MSAWDKVGTCCLLGFVVSTILLQIFGMGAIFGAPTFKPAWMEAVAALAFSVRLACRIACVTLGWVKGEKRKPVA